MGLSSSITLDYTGRLRPFTTRRERVDVDLEDNNKGFWVSLAGPSTLFFK